MTPGNEGSERDAMTATRVGPVSAPGATAFSLEQPSVVAKSHSSTFALRFGVAGLAVASAVVGWVLFGDNDPSLWELGDRGYWPVQELMPAAVAFSIGGAVLLRYRKARWPAGVLLICGLLAGLALLSAGLWWNKALKHGTYIGSSGFIADPLLLANSIATTFSRVSR